MTLQTGHKFVLALIAVLLAVNIGLYLTNSSDPEPVRRSIQIPPPPEPPVAEAQSGETPERDESESETQSHITPDAVPTEVERTESEFERRFFGCELRRFAMVDDEPAKVIQRKEYELCFRVRFSGDPMPFGGGSFGPWDVGDRVYELEP